MARSGEILRMGAKKLAKVKPFKTTITIEQFVDSIQDEKERVIFKSHLNGYTYKMIEEETGVGLSSIYRVISGLYEKIADTLIYEDAYINYFNFLSQKRKTNKFNEDTKTSKEIFNYLRHICKDSYPYNSKLMIQIALTAKENKLYELYTYAMRAITESKIKDQKIKDTLYENLA